MDCKTWSDLFGKWQMMSISTGATVLLYWKEAHILNHPEVGGMFKADQENYIIGSIYSGFRKGLSEMERLGLGVSFEQPGTRDEGQGTREQPS